MGKPAAEVSVTADLVARLLAEQHPDLADLPLTPVAEGWDNAVIRAGARLAVRVPRRALGARLIRSEQRWLPGLAPRLPVDVPVPVRRGRPSPSFPWPWSVVPWFDGDLAARTAPADRTSWAGALADVVRALHRPAPRAAPANPYRGTPLAARDTAVRERLRRLGPDDGAAAARVWARLVRVPAWSGPPQWVHGDLHPANLLVADGALRAVLDFGDLTAGDPATDLATAWLTFDASGRHAFRARLAPRVRTDLATWQRARGWALVMATAMLTADDDPTIVSIGRHALTQVLDERG